MRRAVLADTGPLYAAIDRDDQYHERAQEELERLSLEQFTVMVAYPTLLECYSLVLYRLGLDNARAWLHDVQRGVVLVNPIAQDYAQGITQSQTYKDQALTLFDTLLRSVSTRLTIPIWTYDHHFDIMRSRVWR